MSIFVNYVYVYNISIYRLGMSDFNMMGEGYSVWVLVTCSYHIMCVVCLFIKYPSSSSRKSSTIVDPFLIIFMQLHCNMPLLCHEAW